MKLLFFIMLGLPLLAFTQPYALLHRQLLQPVEVTDRLEVGKTAAHYFPVHTTDLEALIKALDQCIDSLNRSGKVELEKEIRIGHSSMLIRTSNKKEKGCSVFLQTRAKDHGFAYELVNKKDSKLRRQQKMKAFLYYLRNNRVLVQEQTGAIPVNGL